MKNRAPTAPGGVICALGLLLALLSGADALAQGNKLGQALTSAPVATTPYTSDDSFLLGRGANFYRVPGDQFRQSAQLNPTQGTWFVRTAGNDANDCLSTANACLTINAALTKALATDARSNSLTINIGVGTFSENITINGLAVGAINTNGWVGPHNVPVIKFVGAGSDKTTISGGQTVGGQHYCYAFLANHYGAISLEGMTIRADAPPSGCNQSAVYAQFFGTVYFVDDVKVGPTNGIPVFAEEYGQLLVAPGGCGGCHALTFTSSAHGAIGVSAHSLLEADETLYFQGSPIFDNVFIMDDQSSVKLFNSIPTSGSFVGSLFDMKGNSTLTTYFQKTYPGTYGVATQGAIWTGDGLKAPTITGVSGIGATGTASVATGSDPYHGTVTVTPSGSGIPSIGIVGLSLPYALNFAACTASWNDTGTGIFQGGSVFWTAVSGNLISIKFSNGGSTNFTAGQTYPVSYVCH